LALDKKEKAIELQGITKTFGSVVANDHINLEVRRGEILALLGENGSGKTTLMNMISGIYHPDEGTIKINGKEVTINSPIDAGKLGIGMIHQHFKLVDVFSAMDNVAMGMEGKRVKPKELKEKLTKLTEKYGLEVEPEKKIYNMSVSEKQTVEILKVLYRNADILILDEPTAVLTPQETKKLFRILRKMKCHGTAERSRNNGSVYGKRIISNKKDEQAACYNSQYYRKQTKAHNLIMSSFASLFNTNERLFFLPIFHLTHPPSSYRPSSVPVLLWLLFWHLQHRLLPHDT
jgi:ABC-type lipoprotein export system ATPase subunit